MKRFGVKADLESRQKSRNEPSKKGKVHVR